MAEKIKEQPNAILIIRDSAGEIAVQISDGLKLEINESISKDEISSGFWQSLIDWIPDKSSDVLKMKCALIMCFRTMQVIQKSKAIDFDKVEDNGQAWMEAFDTAGGFFY